MSDTWNVDVTRTFDVPLDRAWRAWSEADEVKKWWGPEGFSCNLAEVDLRPGGRTLVGMRAHPELGSFEMYGTWTYDEVEPQTRFTYVFRFSDRDGNPMSPLSFGLVGVPEEGHHEVRLTAIGPGRTRLHMIEAGYTVEEMRDQSKAGLESCLDKMAASFV